MAEYIEREAAENVFRNARKRMKPGDYSGQEFSIRYNILLNAEQIIHLIPAADVVPVRHGRWTDKRTIEHDGEWYCSECNKEITIYMGPDRKDRYAYCPNCRALMDKEDTDGSTAD